MSLLHTVKGKRGEWFLVVQAVLFCLLAAGPRSAGWLPVQLPPLPGMSVSALLLMLGGTLLAACGVVQLGRNLTPLPMPKDDAQLATSGAYAVVRHPIYSGIILISWGWGLWLASVLSLLYALLLTLFFDWKSRFEEVQLGNKFSDYPAYQKRVRKLLPFVY